MYNKLTCALAGAFLLVLAGCDSAEERAETHFQEGMALIEAGDVARGLVELRNVFNLDPLHREARRLYAQTEIERGQIDSGYGQYLRLLEQYPDDVPARRALTSIALERLNWQEIERHGGILMDVAAEDDVARLTGLVLRYREAVEAEDEERRAAVVEEVIAARDALPLHGAVLYQLTADHYIRMQEWEQALSEIEAGLTADPQARPLYALRLAVMQELGDVGAIAEQLREMARLFPDDPSIPQTLIRWYISNGNYDAAEVYLRERAAGNAADEQDDIALLEFLRRFRSSEAALEEVQAMMADGDPSPVLRSVRAGLMFEQGEREAAIADLQAMVEEAEAPSDQLRNVKVALAKMLVATGNRVGARAMIEEVLAEDPSHVAALKMQADWLIESDNTEEAILALREGLAESPRDPELMTLMAKAHERGGSRELMGEMLSLAVEASNGAPTESLRYAKYLMAEDKADVAEATLVESLRLNPGHVELLATLGGLHVRRGDWSRAEQVVRTLTSIDDPNARAAANSLQARILAGQGQTDEVVNFLERLVDEGEAGIGAQAAIVRSHIENGNIEAAERYVESLLQENPGDLGVKFLSAALAEARGEDEAAEAIHEEILEAKEDAVLAWRSLYLLQRRAGREDDAAATLDAALAANPRDANLQWLRASELQAVGDFEGALEIYAALYEQDSSAVIIANNYASLLSTLRDDDESIERAWNIARRLRGMEVPAFQDTLGWIAYLRGDYETAVSHLEPAAESLSDDPTIQYHLGMTYAALDRRDEAVAALERSVSLAEGDELPFLNDARNRIAELSQERASE